MTDPQKLQDQAKDKAAKGDHKGAAQDYEAAAQAHAANGDDSAEAAAYQKAAREQAVTKNFDGAGDDYAKAAAAHTKAGDDSAAADASVSAAKMEMKGSEADVTAAGDAKDAGDAAWKAGRAAEALSEGPPKNPGKDAEAAAEYAKAAAKYAEASKLLDSALAGFKLAIVQALKAETAEKRVIARLVRMKDDASKAQAKLTAITALEVTLQILKAVNEAALGAVDKLKKKLERMAKREKGETREF